MVLPASCANGADVSAFDHPPQTLTLTLTRFRTLDPDNKGYIEADKLRNLLTTHGERFSQEEIDDFLTFASDSESGRMHKASQTPKSRWRHSAPHYPCTTLASRG